MADVTAEMDLSSEIATRWSVPTKNLGRPGAAMTQKTRVCGARKPIGIAGFVSGSAPIEGAAAMFGSPPYVCFF